MAKGWPTKSPEGEDLALYQDLLERTTGFEPATLTLAKKGDGKRPAR